MTHPLGPQDQTRTLRRAEDALHEQPTSVVDHPAPLGSGDPHAFTSMADYFWPDPQHPDGPWLPRDGRSYPGLFNAHRAALMQMRDATAALAAAHLLTGEQRLADAASRWWQRFFLDDGTAMAPHLEQAQLVVGGERTDWGVGLIDTLHLVEVALGALLLEDVLEPAVRAGLQRWFADYLEWFLTSPKGRDEAEAINNHGVAAWVQAAAFARLLGRDDVVAEARRRLLESFLPDQMQLDGSFPLELRRTKPYAYSVFQVDLLAQLCQLTTTPDHDVWRAELADGRGMPRAIEWLAPWLADRTTWPHPPDVEGWQEWPVRAPALLLGGHALGRADWVALWHRLPVVGPSLEIRRNNPVTQPLLWLALAEPVVSS